MYANICFNVYIIYQAKGFKRYLSVLVPKFGFDHLKYIIYHTGHVFVYQLIFTQTLVSDILSIGGLM